MRLAFVNLVLVSLTVVNLVAVGQTWRFSETLIVSLVDYVVDNEYSGERRQIVLKCPDIVFESPASDENATMVRVTLVGPLVEGFLAPVVRTGNILVMVRNVDKGEYQFNVNFRHERLTAKFGAGSHLRVDDTNCDLMMTADFGNAYSSATVEYSRASKMFTVIQSGLAFEQMDFQFQNVSEDFSRWVENHADDISGKLATHLNGVWKISLEGIFKQVNKVINCLKDNRL
ncbi:hypothetical protein HDE_02461 [Halotydeus destructor]|nr:hypothetical protein HDE_02461 [Halotydeus destructor]